MGRPPFIVVAGPTASGKSSLAMLLAQRFNGQIVCCDSVQLYRGFDIGSAKPSIEDRNTVPHHLFDILECAEPFSAGDFRERALNAITKIGNSGSLPIVVGGTGLYLRALLGDVWDDDLPDDPNLRIRLNEMPTERVLQLLNRLDQGRCSEIHVNDRYRLVRALELRVLTGKPAAQRSVQRVNVATSPVRPFTIILDPPRHILHERIASRCAAMLKSGLVDEVRNLLMKGCANDSKPMQSIGYRQVVEWLDSGRPETELIEQMVAATRQYAKRQVTWFKKTSSDLRFVDIDISGLVQIVGEKLNSNLIS